MKTLDHFVQAPSDEGAVALCVTEGENTATILTEIFRGLSAHNFGINPRAIVATFPYHHGKAGNIARYAQGQDYHKWVVKDLEVAVSRLKLLYPNNNFTPHADSSPLVEVVEAAKCGLGVIGKHRLLITEAYGSFVFLGVILHDLEGDFSDLVPQPCDDCGVCKIACPVHFDFENCLSKITQKKGDLSDFETALLAQNRTIWGCDLCQIACPKNQNTDDPEPRGCQVETLQLKTLEQMSDNVSRETFRDYAFIYKGKQPLVRNLKILAANQTVGVDAHIDPQAQKETQK